MARLRPRSCIIHGEAVCCGDDGVPSFDRIRYRRHDASVFLHAFDLIELNGDDLRRNPLEARKATLANILARADRGIWFNDHIEDDGPTVFKHACKLGLEGIVEAKGLAVSQRPVVRLAQVEKPSLRGSAARRRGRLGAMMHREDLAHVDRLIAECKNRIARQREIIASAYESGHPTVLPVSLLRVLEENLRSFEKHRQLVLDQLKKTDRQ
jgi:hypothetical protein